jgi:haloalkane dehalogenase
MAGTSTNVNEVLDGTLPFLEHRIPREQGSIYVRDYGGVGPAFVLMHGFPDNLRI